MIDKERFSPPSAGGIVLNSGAVVLDVNDIEREAAFWSVVIDEEPGPLRGDGGWLTVGELAPAMWLVLQRVPEAKLVKNRCHLDFHVTDVDEALRKIIVLGGSQVGEIRPGGGVTCADPEGNEFCIGAFKRDKSGNRVY
ncbi:MAG: VOC family protein [Chloroflexi bacterium]|nr:VOC family protein [Chloroflexota bacterium]